MAAVENPSLKPVMEVIKSKRPHDWGQILDFVVAGIIQYKKDPTDHSLVDYLDENPDIDILLSTPSEDLPLDSHKELQSPLAFIRNRLTTEEERHREMEEFKLKRFPQDSE